MAIKISELTEVQANPETDFLEISRDNGDGTFSSYKSPASVGGDGYMLGEIRYFATDPGIDWLRLDGSEIDPVQYPDLAQTAFVKTINPGEYVSHTLNTSTGDATPGQVYNLYSSDIRYLPSTNEIVIWTAIYQDGGTANGKIFIMDCETEVVRDLTITIDGSVPSSNPIFPSGTIDYNGDSYMTMHYDSVTYFAKVTGGIGGKTGNINIETISVYPENLTSASITAPIAASTEYGIIAGYYSGTIHISEDGGLSFASIDGTDISNLLEATPVEHMEFNGDNLMLVEMSTDGIIMSSKVSTLLDLSRNGPTSSNVGNGVIYPGYFNQEFTYNYGFSGRLVTNSGVMVSSIFDKNLGILPSYDGSILDVSNKFNGSLPGRLGNPCPAGSGFFFIHDETNTNVKLYYSDYNSGIISIDENVSPPTSSNDPVGYPVYSDTSNKLFVFYYDGSNAYSSKRVKNYNSYNVTLSDTDRKFLPNYQRKGGAYAYVKAVL